MANGADGKFQATELAVRMSGTDFVVDCNFTALVADCGQNTARTLELPVDYGNLERLMADLRAVLVDLEALESRRTLSTETSELE